MNSSKRMQYIFSKRNKQIVFFFILYYLIGKVVELFIHIIHISNGWNLIDLTDI